MKRQTEIRISGLGGQGVILAGQILGKAAVYDGKNAVQTQSYGAEARGSAAKSEVIISDDKIGFPGVRQCDVLVAMSQAAVDTYLKDLKKNGVLIVDSSNVKSISKTGATVYKVPATATAKKTYGVQLYANMIMLGVLANQLAIRREAMKKAISEGVPKTTAKTNIQAFKKGIELISLSKRKEATAG